MNYFPWKFTSYIYFLLLEVFFPNIYVKRLMQHKLKKNTQIDRLCGRLLSKCRWHVREQDLHIVDYDKRRCELITVSQSHFLQSSLSLSLSHFFKLRNKNFIQWISSWANAENIISKSTSFTVLLGFGCYEEGIVFKCWIYQWINFYLYFR